MHDLTHDTDATRDMRSSHVPRSGASKYFCFQDRVEECLYLIATHPPFGAEAWTVEERSCFDLAACGQPVYHKDDAVLAGAVVDSATWRFHQASTARAAALLFNRGPAHRERNYWSALPGIDKRSLARTTARLISNKFRPYSGKRVSSDKGSVHGSCCILRPGQGRAAIALTLSARLLLAVHSPTRGLFTAG